MQLLTPCTIGNGWLKVINLGRFAVILYDKYEGEGVRVWLDPAKVADWSEINNWYLKLKSKTEQDKGLLLAQIKEAGTDLLSWRTVKIRPPLLTRKRRGRIVLCPLCREAYPAQDGGICRACQGEVPYLEDEAAAERAQAETPSLQAVPLEEAVGRRALHDMTRIIPGRSKGPAVKRGECISVGDLCRLQQMGRHHLYVISEDGPGPEWVPRRRGRPGLCPGHGRGGRDLSRTTPREGKVNLMAARDGLLAVDAARLERFNLVPGVMCACTGLLYPDVSGSALWAAPGPFPCSCLGPTSMKALTVLEATAPCSRYSAAAAAPASASWSPAPRSFMGLVEDKFVAIISTKVEKFQAVRWSEIFDRAGRPARPSARGCGNSWTAGIDLLVTTAGLSVDPDDVTRQGLVDAGATDMLYGAPILPGAMTLLARIGPVQVMGVPACALYFKTTSFDLLLPRLLAGLDLPGAIWPPRHGAFCLECKVCTFPNVPWEISTP